MAARLGALAETSTEGGIVLMSSNLGMFSQEGVRGSIEDLIAALRSEKTSNQEAQVEFQTTEIIGQMQRLRRPIQRPDKGATHRSMIPAVEMGINLECVEAVINLISRSSDAYSRNDTNRAIQLAEDALRAWDSASC